MVPLSGTPLKLFFPLPTHTSVLSSLAFPNGPHAPNSFSYWQRPNCPCHSQPDPMMLAHSLALSSDYSAWATFLHTALWQTDTCPPRRGSPLPRNNSFFLPLSSLLLPLFCPLPLLFLSLCVCLCMCATVCLSVCIYEGTRNTTV